MNSVFIDCSSPLLQKNLEVEFQRVLSNRKDAEVIITDYLECKNCLKIGVDIQRPLFIDSIRRQLSPEDERVEQSREISKNFNSDDFRKALESLTAKYVNDVIKMTEEFYGQR